MFRAVGQKAPVFHTLLWHRPNLDEVYKGRRDEPIAVYASGGGETRPIGAVDFTPKPMVQEVEVFLHAGEVLPADRRLPAVPDAGQRHGRAVRQPPWRPRTAASPGYAVQWVEVEGPFYDDPVGGAGYRLLFDDRKLVLSEKAREAVLLEVGPAAGGGRGPGGLGRGGGLREAPYEVESKVPREDAERLLRALRRRIAGRRPRPAWSLS